MKIFAILNVNFGKEIAQVVIRVEDKLLFCRADGTCFIKDYHKNIFIQLVDTMFYRSYKSTFKERVAKVLQACNIKNYEDAQKKVAELMATAEPI